MPMPIAVMTSHTGTGDTVVGPGSMKVLCKGKPAVTMGASVTGAACVGTAAVNPNPQVLVENKPVLHLTSQATGSNPATGAPVTTPIIDTSATTILS
jgi:hypothetical protein